VAAPATTTADQDDADMGAAMTANTQAANGVNAQGQNVTMPGGINPETGAPTIVTAGAAPAPPATPAVAAQPKLPTSFGQVISTQLGTAVGQVSAIFAQTGARLAGTIVTNRLSDAIISANSAPPVNTPEQIVAPTDDSSTH
jgi:hypothetical protein